MIDAPQTPLNRFLDSKEERFIIGTLSLAFLAYSLYNLHLSIKLNKRKLKEYEAMGQP